MNRAQRNVAIVTAVIAAVIGLSCGIQAAAHALLGRTGPLELMTTPFNISVASAVSLAAGLAAAYLLRYGREGRPENGAATGGAPQIEVDTGVCATLNAVKACLGVAIPTSEEESEALTLVNDAILVACLLVAGTTQKKDNDTPTVDGVAATGDSASEK